MKGKVDLDKVRLFTAELRNFWDTHGDAGKDICCHSSCDKCPLSASRAGGCLICHFPGVLENLDLFIALTDAEKNTPGAVSGVTV